MSPLPTEKKSLSYTHLNSQAAVQNTLQKRKEIQVKFSCPNPPLLIVLNNRSANAKVCKEKPEQQTFWPV